MEKPLVEVTRSYSFKKSLPNYQNVDFFCSRKMEVPLEEADKTSAELFRLCKRDVEISLAEYNIEMAQKETAKPIPEYIKKAFKNDAEQEAGESSRQENNK
jgi:hypothetical protein